MVRGGDDQFWGSGRGGIAGCHCSVLWWGQGRQTFGEWAWCHCRVPLQCAMVWGEGDDQLWGSEQTWCPLLGAIAGCHCSVLSWGKGRVTVDVVPLLGAIGAIVVCYAWGEGAGSIAGSIMGCSGGWHCRVPLWCAMVRPSLGEWAWCHCWVPLHGVVVLVAVAVAVVVVAVVVVVVSSSSSRSRSRSSAVAQ